MKKLYSFPYRLINPSLLLFMPHLVRKRKLFANKCRDDSKLRFVDFPRFSSHYGLFHTLFTKSISNSPRGAKHYSNDFSVYISFFSSVKLASSVYYERSAGYKKCEIEIARSNTQKRCRLTVWKKLLSHHILPLEMLLRVQKGNYSIFCFKRVKQDCAPSATNMWSFTNEWRLENDAM